MKPKPSAYTQLVSRVLFPLHERLKGHATPAALRALERSQWWERERIEALRAERLRALLVHAGLHVPYYRQLFAQRGFDPTGVDGLDCLREVPFLTKPIIRALGDALRSERAGPVQRYSTGGSSGEPLVFGIGRRRVTHDVAAKWRATRWWGVDIGDPEVVIWGSPIELGAQDRVRAVRDRMLRTTLLPAFDMSDRRIDAFLETIVRRRPRMVFGYPSAVTMVMQRAQSRGVRLDSLGLRVVFVTGEQLYPAQREAIEAVANCPVAMGYGGRDAGFVAHECPAGGLHVSAEDIVVEVIDEHGGVLPPGASGELVVTHLATRDFPFIRYRTGDIGALDPKPCACGRGLPLLREVQGRSTDFVVTPDGTRMHALALIYVLRERPEVAAFKIVQDAPDAIRVLVVPAPGWSTACEDAIRKGLGARLGLAVQIRIELTERIAADRSGKYRYVVSNAS